MDLSMKWREISQMRWPLIKTMFMVISSMKPRELQSSMRKLILSWEEAHPSITFARTAILNILRDLMMKSKENYKRLKLLKGRRKLYLRLLEGTYLRECQRYLWGRVRIMIFNHHLSPIFTLNNIQIRNSKHLCN